MAWTAPKTDFASGNILTAAQMNAIGDNLVNLQAARPLNRVTMTSATVSTTGTSFATGTEVFTTDLTFTSTINYDYMVEFFAPAVETSVTADRYVTLALSNGSGTELGRIGYVGYATGRAVLVPVRTTVRFTATATGTTTLNVVFWGSAAGTSLVYGGNGGAGNNYPATLTVWGPVNV